MFDSSNIPFRQSVNYRPERHQTCSLIVLHYTASGALEPTVDYLCKTNPAKASAHYVVGRTAAEGVAQLVNLDDVAYHAGESHYPDAKGVTKDGVSFFSVGIEICNWGPLTLDPDGYFENCYRQRVTGRPAIKIGDGWWEKFTDFQYAAVAELCRLIMAKFPLITVERIVGHSDVSPGRKIDPGPAWDWDRFRDLIK